MPKLYPDLRTEIALDAIEYENNKDLIKTKIMAHGGIQYLSADNINKINALRVEMYNNFISKAFPYIEMPKEKELGEADDLVKDFWKMVESGQINPGSNEEKN